MADAAAVYRPFGPADNAAFYSTWLKTDVLFDKLFLSTLNIDPFRGDLCNPMVPTMAYLAWYGRCLDLYPDKSPNKNSCYIASWADLMGPCVVLTKFVTEQEAGGILIRSVSNLVKPANLNIISTASINSYVGEGLHRTNDIWNSFLDLEENGDRTPQQAMAILEHIADNAHAAFRIGGVSMIVHVCLATLKRGTMSEGFCNKIIDGIRIDLRIPNLTINVENCQLLYAIFGTYINDVSMPIIIARWTALMPINAMRIRLTIQQAAGSGLTALSTIGRAIRIYTDFDWSRVHRMYPDEWANYVTAVTAVGNNVWYGFRHDLGPVSSTKYKNLAYVAKELLIKVGGESSLRAYAGWTRRAKYQATVDLLVTNYEECKTRNIADDQPMPVIVPIPEVVNLRNTIILNGDVY